MRIETKAYIPTGRGVFISIHRRLVMMMMCHDHVRAVRKALEMDEEDATGVLRALTERLRAQIKKRGKHEGLFLDSTAECMREGETRAFGKVTMLILMRKRGYEVVVIAEGKEDGA